MSSKPSKCRVGRQNTLQNVVLQVKMSFCTTFYRLRGQNGVQQMIKCRLSILMGERKLKIADVARETGLHRGTVTSLYKETTERIDLDTIDILCQFLECDVGELFVRVQE